MLTLEQCFEAAGSTFPFTIEGPQGRKTVIGRKGAVWSLGKYEFTADEEASYALAVGPREAKEAKTPEPTSGQAFELHLGDCLEVMKKIPSGSVDMILCDLPYGTTACKWDTIIPFDALWREYERVIKESGSVVLFGSEPFSSLLRQSNLRLFKYDWIWEKSKSSGFMQAKRAPLRCHEVISVFSKASISANYGTPPVYNPQGLQAVEKTVEYSGFREQFGQRKPKTYKQTATGYPKTVLKFQSESKTVHPTQKPVALLEYLIRTYTNAGELVLDNCMGSGSTGVASLNTGRRFIGIEKEPAYFEIAKKRIEASASNAAAAKEEPSTESASEPNEQPVPMQALEAA